MMKKQIALVALLFLGMSCFNASAQFKKFNLGKAIQAGKDAAQAISLSDADIAAMSKEYMEWMDKHNPLTKPDSEYGKRLERLTGNIKEVDGMKVNFGVYEVVDVNAFACGDGSVRICAGLMDVMTDEEVMAVIGHEIGHVIHTDSKDAMKNAYFRSAVKNAAGAASSQVAKLTDSELGAMAEALAGAQYSQKQEYEADAYGVEFCVKNNIDPYGMYKSLNKLLELSNGAPASSYMQRMFSSHPDTAKRVARAKELADKYIEEYFIDAKGLGIHHATVHPRATENIDAIIDIIQKLFDSGYAYNVDGDVYYSTKKFKSYGKLSHQPLEDLESGARIEVNEDKHEPMDFALWKKQKPGEPAWESPWGMGRPGWHIECSAMANKYLDKTIDIHSGGQDLIFPHHENEIAQSEAANCCQFANYWVHNGYINVDNRKMSKSLGNFFTVRDVAKEFDYEVIRFFMLSAHYRSPINFSKDLMESASSALERIYTCIDTLKFLKKTASGEDARPEEIPVLEAVNGYKQKFIDAMDDDLNTADAISVIFEIVSEVNKNITSASEPSEYLIEYILSVFDELGSVLGILGRKEKETVPDEVKEMLEERKNARADKDWAKSDLIRDKLKDFGYSVKDTAQGQQLIKL